MEKTLIRVDCIDQRLYISTAPTLASGGRNEDEIEFSFCALWDEFEKVAVFYRDKENVYHATISENRCIIPHEVLVDEGWMHFGVFGVKDDIIRTSEIMRYRVTEGAITEGTTPSDPTPDIYAQILADMGDLKTRVSALETNSGGTTGGGNPPLVGTTEEITPSQVFTAILEEHRDVIIQASLGDGSVYFTAFLVLEPMGLFSVGFAPNDDGTFSYVMLVGTLADDTWAFALDALKGINPQPITFTGVVHGTYDGSGAVTINIPTIAGEKGEDGVTFTPTVTTTGTLSWTNDGGLPNPAAVNIKGDKGDTGTDGYSPVVTISKADKLTTIKITTAQGDAYARVSDGADGADGAKGDKGDTGADGYSPVRGVDYWTEADKDVIVQAVVAELGGQPVIGTVGSDNSINLNGNLADGTYTLKYVQSDGSTVTIGELVVGEVEKMINQIPISTDTDGSVYNGTGWKTGYRINSSGAVTAQSGYELTGFIPFKKGDVLRGNEGIIGLAAAGGNVSNTNYNVISFFNASKGFIANEGLGASSTADGLTINSDDSFVFDSNLNSKATDAVAYIRVTTVNITASSILTVNQEIV